MPRKPDPLKRCDHCGTPFTRQSFGERLEDRSAFLRRRFCSLTCANSRRNPKNKSTYSLRARQHIKLACEACGATKALHAHHVDQSILNNEPTNIQTLCKQCHDFWHATQKRRGWLIAGRMPPLR